MTPIREKGEMRVRFEFDESGVIRHRDRLYGIRDYQIEVNEAGKFSLRLIGGSYGERTVSRSS